MKKRSLHVGLNYPETSAELSGCVNDAFDWRDFFGALDYSPAVIVEPTGYELLTAITEGLDGLTWGDRFVFTYSGHGSFVPDRNGDEIDGFDEVLCPRDYEQGVITDDQLAATFDTARLGVRRTFLSDSCHSGSVNRFVPTYEALDRKVRFLPPSFFMSDRRLANVTTTVVPRSSRVPALLISGCGDREYSYDAWFGQRPNGAFTRVAIDAYKQGDTMVRWHRAIRTGLPSASFPQTPQLGARVHQRYWKL